MRLASVACASLGSKGDIAGDICLVNVEKGGIIAPRVVNESSVFVLVFCSGINTVIAVVFVQVQSNIS